MIKHALKFTVTMTLFLLFPPAFSSPKSTDGETASSDISASTNEIIFANARDCLSFEYAPVETENDSIKALRLWFSHSK